jgi:hypothetical protein
MERKRSRGNFDSPFPSRWRVPQVAATACGPTAPSSRPIFRCRLPTRNEGPTILLSLIASKCDLDYAVLAGPAQNRAVCRWLGSPHATQPQHLGVPRSRLEILGGESTRLKEPREPQKRLKICISHPKSPMFHQQSHAFHRYFGCILDHPAGASFSPEPTK